MTKPFYFLFTLFIIFSCNSPNSADKPVEGDVEVVDISQVSNEKKEIVNEIKTFKKDLDEGNFEGIANHLDTPKRIEEIELSLKNPKIRNSVESNSSRLSIEVIKNEYDLIYQELDLNIINDALKVIPEEELLTRDKAVTTVKVGECDYFTEVSISGKDVKFNIKSESQSENCKKSQQWKFISNGESLVLDRRYYL